MGEDAPVIAPTNATANRERRLRAAGRMQYAPTGLEQEPKWASPANAGYSRPPTCGHVRYHASPVGAYGIHPVARMRRTRLPAEVISANDWCILPHICSRRGGSGSAQLVSGNRGRYASLKIAVQRTGVSSDPEADS